MKDVENENARKEGSGVFWLKRARRRLYWNSLAWMTGPTCETPDMGRALTHSFFGASLRTSKLADRADILTLKVVSKSVGLRPNHLMRIPKQGVREEGVCGER